MIHGAGKKLVVISSQIHVFGREGWEEWFDKNINRKMEMKKKQTFVMIKGVNQDLFQINFLEFIQIQIERS